MNWPLLLRHRLAAAVAALACLAVTLVVLAGMPYVLWRAAGVPWPDRVASWSHFGRQLLEPLSDPLTVDLLATVGWVCWAAFAWTAVRQLVWYAVHVPQLARDHRLHHRHVAALSVRDSLAAVCIGTLTIALLAVWRPQTADAQQALLLGDAGACVTATAPYVPHIPAAVSRKGPGAAASASAASVSATGTSAGRGPAETAKTARRVTYTVHEGDTLWEIARARTGDGSTWPHIYALNESRSQPDGTRLTDPDLIRPGWNLTVPATSTERPATTGPTPLTARPQDQHPDRRGHTEQEPSGTQSEARNPSQQGNDSHSRPEATSPAEPVTFGFGQAFLAGTVTAAGLLAAGRFWFRNRRSPDQEGHVPALSPIIGQAASVAHGAPEQRPSSAQEPYPPPHASKTPATATATTEPQPSLPTPRVSIGTRGGVEVLLDELAVPGGCVWTGPGADGAARALLAGVLTAAARRTSGTSPVKAIVSRAVAEQLLPALPAAQFPGLTHSTDLDEALRVAEEHLIAHARVLADQDVPPAAHQCPGTASDSAVADPGTLLLLAAPDAAHVGRFRALAGRSHPGRLIVLSLGVPLPGGPVPWHIELDGTTAPASADGQYATPLHLFRLTHEAGQDVTDALLTASAEGQRPQQSSAPSPGSRSEAEPPEEPSVGTVDDTSVGLPSAADASAPEQAKPVRLHVLGPVRLYVRGQQHPVGTHLRGRVREFLALLAAHPTGLLATDVADKLQLAPGTDQNELKNLRRAVRRTLRAATGITAQEFILRQGELHKLHPDLVETDLEDFNRALPKSFSDGRGEPGDVVDAVREAMKHYRGPFAQGSDYVWVDAIRQHLAIQATDAALGLARRAEQQDSSPRERNAVLNLLEQLNILHPDHEALAQHAIRLYQIDGRHDAARHVYSRLKRHLADLGLEPEPGTEALVMPTRRTQHPR